MFNKKPQKFFSLIFISIFFIALFLCGLVWLEMSKQIPLAQAGTSQNVSGYAWSSNYGWISFNCTNDSSCGTADYGVNIDSATGNFSGYAWSPNLGWVDFAPSSGYPQAPNYSVKYDKTTGSVAGWAKVLALGDNGWLEMSGTWTNGVSIDVSGKFSGYAWNGNNDGTGVGWISFNGTSPDYGVVYATPYPATPTMGAISNTSGPCKLATVNWTDNSSNETGFEVDYSQDESSWSSFCATAANIVSCTGIVLPSTNYYFRVKALGQTGYDSSWSPNVNGQGFTSSYCAASGLVVDSYNCAGVKLEWSAPVGTIDHYELKRSVDGVNYSTINASIPASTTSYTDKPIDSSLKNVTYKLDTVFSGTPSTILESNATSPALTQPCPNLPIFKEVKPK
ncbi:MAG: hypothetical protein PHT51_02515 [Patescibacteria group bacterium]|nr:hypothetical protein [Patescibacteria group bacterium]MDD4611268.1 hypothetical protein [Patescibacteria group bacterium]